MKYAKVSLLGHVTLIGEVCRSTHHDQLITVRTFSLAERSEDNGDGARRIYAAVPGRRLEVGPQAIYTIEWLADEEAALELAREEVQRAYRFECDDGEVPW